MTTRRYRRILTFGLALLASALGWGCMTTGFRTCRQGQVGCQAGSLGVRVYDTPAAKAHDRVTERPVQCELDRPRRGGDELVHSATTATWSLEGLAPGRHRLAISVVEPGGGERSCDRRLDIPSAQGVAVRVVVSNWHVPAGWSVASAAVVGVSLLIAQEGLENSMSHLFDEPGAR